MDRKYVTISNNGNVVWINNEEGVCFLRICGLDKAENYKRVVVEKIAQFIDVTIIGKDDE